MFFPLGIDLLLVGLTANHHDRWLYFAGMATVGSVIACFTTGWIGRQGGEAGLEIRISKRGLKFIQKPGFPFTPVVLVAATLKYPRPKLLGIIAVFRFVRFSAEALLAFRYGRGVLRVAQSKPVEIFIFTVVLVYLAGTGWVILSWIPSSRPQRS